MLKMSNEDNFPQLKNITTISGNKNVSSVKLFDNTTTDLPTYEQTFNGTGFYVENDDVDNSFSDLQTLFLACFATLIPLVLSVLTAFAVRILWRKYKQREECKTYDEVLHVEESTNHLPVQPGAPLHTHLLNSEKVKPSESDFSTTPDDIERTDVSSAIICNSNSSTRTNHASTNGSVITMTLKNNHLIVETEERTDIIEDSRETTMKYSPSAQDGVFVVEVQQGLRTFQCGENPDLDLHEDAEDADPDADTSDQQALVHNPPDRFSEEDTLEEIDEEFYIETTSPHSSIRTGFAQSSLSIASSDPTSCYRNGNQQGYDNGYYGNANDVNARVPTSPWRPPSTKPKITAAVYKENGRRLMSMTSLDADGGLSSDRLAKEDYYVDDAIQAEQMRLGNGNIADTLGDECGMVMNDNGPNAN